MMAEERRDNRWLEDKFQDIKSDLGELKKGQSELRNIILGNGGQPGLKVESDRNTQFRKNMTKFFWLIIAAIIGMNLMPSIVKALIESAGGK